MFIWSRFTNTTSGRQTTAARSRFNRARLFG